jgi:hypothetical protein
MSLFDRVMPALVESDEVASLTRAHEHAYGQLRAANAANDYKRRDVVHKGLLTVSHKLAQAHERAGTKPKKPLYHQEFYRHAQRAESCLFDRIMGESMAHAARQQRAGVPGLGPKMAHGAERQARRIDHVTRTGWAPETRAAEHARQSAHLGRRGKGPA